MFPHNPAREYTSAAAYTLVPDISTELTSMLAPSAALTSMLALSSAELTSILAPPTQYTIHIDVCSLAWDRGEGGSSAKPLKGK